MTDDERATKRAELVTRYGFDPWIPEATVAEIAAIVEQHWRVIRREFNGFTLTFEVCRTTNVPLKTYLEVEGQLAERYGNAPHMLAQDFMPYRLTFMKP